MSDKPRNPPTGPKKSAPKLDLIAPPTGAALTPSEAILAAAATPSPARAVAAPDPASTADPRPAGLTVGDAPRPAAGGLDASSPAADGDLAIDHGPPATVESAGPALTERVAQPLADDPPQQASAALDGDEVGSPRQPDAAAPPPRAPPVADAFLKAALQNPLVAMGRMTEAPMKYAEAWVQNASAVAEAVCTVQAQAAAATRAALDAQRAAAAALMTVKTPQEFLEVQTSVAQAEFTRYRAGLAGWFDLLTGVANTAFAGPSRPNAWPES